MEPRPHIVVVEDEATQRQLLVDYLTRQNFRVTGVDGGIALRKLIERELPALERDGVRLNRLRIPKSDRF